MSLLRAFVRFFFTHFYTTLAWSYDLVAWLVSLGKWNDWVRSAIPAQGLDPVLELGYGTGHLQLALNRGGRLAFGVDASRQMSRISGRRLRRNGFPLHLVQARAEALPFPGGSFGAVVSTFPTEYIVMPATLSEAGRSLRPGGQFTIVPMAEIVGHRLLERAAAWLFRVTGQSGELPPIWEQPFHEAGFDTQRDELTVRNSRLIRVVARRRPAEPAGAGLGRSRLGDQPAAEQTT